MRQTSIPPAEVEPAIPERLQTHALDRAATGIGKKAYTQAIWHKPSDFAGIFPTHIETHIKIQETWQPNKGYTI